RRQNARVVRSGLAGLQLLPTDRSAATTQVARCPKFAAHRQPGVDLAGAGTGGGRLSGPGPLHASPGGRGGGDLVTTGHWSQNRVAPAYENNDSDLTCRTPVTGASEVTPTTADSTFNPAEYLGTASANPLGIWAH